ncbi:AsmA-like C-terminal region-containing protein [Kangiella sp.]|uniref:AsmA-like C-terminal region-containing protein n=1 Tax=Kangiella sp. TaxID=1920245 RepID=UPI0019C1A486|nr:AsmA-like C-terminal region-containing protein [Kangiella sp.]MBD3652806.1 hypothetical protein [Kangiella sp.]
MTRLWKWSKRLLWVLAGLFVLLILSVSILVYLINSESFLEKQIQEQLGMSSQVGELDVSLFSGTVSISKTRIGPEDNPAITFEQLTAQISYSGLFSSLLIDSIELDKAVIRYPFDYQLAESKEAEVNNDNEAFFFEQLNVSEIRINSSDFVFNDDVYLEAKGINLVVSELPVAQRSIFLFTHLTDFFKQSNTTIVADIEQFKTDKSSLSQVNLKAEVIDSDVVIQELSSASADINIELTDNQTSNANTANQTSGNSQVSQASNLPFKDLLIEKIDIGTTNFKLQGSYELAVEDFQAHFSELILVKDKAPLWVDWEEFYRQQNSRYSLSSKALTSSMLSYDQLELDGELNGSAFNIKQMMIAQPLVSYSSGEQTETAEATESEVPTAGGNAALRFPFATIMLNQLTVNDGELNLQLDDSYTAQAINLQVQQLPIILDHGLVIADPASWPSTVIAKLDASNVSLPQVTAAEFLVEAQSESGKLDVSSVQISDVNLELDFAGSEQADRGTDSDTASSAVTMPFETIGLHNITVQQFGMVANLEGETIEVDNASIEIADFPLVLEGAMFGLDSLASVNTSFSITTDRFQTNQLTVSGLSANGNLTESRLVLVSVANRSGKLNLDLTNQPEQRESDSKSKASSNLPLQSLVVNKLNIRNFNGDILRLVEKINAEGETVSTKESLVITDIDLMASNLSLIKNRQLISQWYESQLQNAFKTLELKVAKAQQDEDIFSDIDIKATQANRKIAVNPLTVNVNDTNLNADWVIDLSQPGYASDFKFDFENLELSQLVRPDNEESIALRGKLSGLADLTFTGLSPEKIFDSLNGQVLIANTEPVQLINLNVNKVLERFLESQEFGLLDIGGFVLAGPAGLLLSQGVSMQGVLSNLGANKGDTMFGQINIDMTIENGVLKTRDVAASTQYYRFAFDGNIDLSIMAFNDFEFMILNDEGCKEYSQTLNGSLSSPEIETFRTAFDAVTGSVVGLLKSGVGLLTGGYCEGVYDGKVAHPEEGVEIPHPELKPEEPEQEGEPQEEPEVEAETEPVEPTQ